MSSRSGDELIELLLTEEMDPEEEGKTANDLLAEVIRGYPALNLSRLIHSDNRRAVEAGAFVVSELGAKAAQVIGEVDFLLSDQSRNARFDAIDATLAAASSEHGAIIAKAVTLVVDSDQAVRWKALRFLAKATQDQLAAAAPHLADRHMADLVEWLEVRGSGFRRRVASFAEANDIPVVTLKAADRNIEVMCPYLDKAAAGGRSQVAAIGVAQEMQRVFVARQRDTDPSKPPQFSFDKKDRRVTVCYF